MNHVSGKNHLLQEGGGSGIGVSGTKRSGETFQMALRWRGFLRADETALFTTSLRPDEQQAACMLLSESHQLSTIRRVSPQNSNLCIVNCLFLANHTSYIHVSLCEYNSRLQGHVASIISLSNMEKQVFLALTSTRNNLWQQTMNAKMLCISFGVSG